MEWSGSWDAVVEHNTNVHMCAIHFTYTAAYKCIIISMLMYYHK